MPSSYVFAAKNIDPKSCFKTVRNASHQANAMAVANKQVAAATNNSEDLQRAAATAPEARKKLRIIWTSPIIPLDPLVWRKDIDPAIKTKIYTFLMSYGRIGTPDEVRPRVRYCPASSGRRSIPRATTSFCRSAFSKPTRRS